MRADLTDQAEGADGGDRGTADVLPFQPVRKPATPLPGAGITASPMPTVGAIPGAPATDTAVPFNAAPVNVQEQPSAVPAVGAVTPSAAPDLVPFQAGGSVGTTYAANPNATPGNAFSGMTSAEGGQFGPDAGTRLDSGGIKSILGGNGQYDALADRLAANPALYKQWQGVLNNDPASVAAAMASGDADLTGIAKQYAERNANDSGIAFGPQGQAWRDVAAGTYKPQGTSPFLSQPDLPVVGAVPSAAAPGAGGAADGAVATGPGTIITSSAPPASGGPSGAGAPAGAPPTPTGTAGMGNVARTATQPGTALTTQTLSRAPGADRYQLALQGLKDWNAASAPEFEADRRSTERRAAGRGQLGSGMLRTREGDLVANREKQRQYMASNALRDALTGSIEDSFRDVGVAQQQQGFQQGQQESAFEQALREAQGEDALTNSAFNRDLQRSAWGSQGNPGATQLDLADIYAKQAAGATGAAGAAGSAAGTPKGGGSYLDLLQQFFAKYGLGGGGGASAQVPDYATP